ncbi:YceD family protein [Paludifilum halophilum]|uniref:Metal-binding protein n=1 Tax=Paludifilum halophilum TaxID=1642702 RepID=A0A235B2G6_9BACL|nr:DUF177 domain-containing protein [Paludifilum halophilum]OYD06441.1 hypothetical protein CHM34_16230 [Paludifilum halophilum]
MLISLRELNQNTGPIEREASVELKGLEKEHPELLRIEPLEVHVTAWKDRDLFHVQGKQSTTAEFRCSRCLTSFEQKLTMDWYELFSDEEQRAQADSEEERDEEIHFAPPDQPLDLTPYIREALLLRLPFAPLCREDCRGLCPECGVDRNVDTCQCRTERIDPRLAKLEELLKRDEE